MYGKFREDEKIEVSGKSAVIRSVPPDAQSEVALRSVSVPLSGKPESLLRLPEDEEEPQAVRLIKGAAISREPPRDRSFLRFRGLSVITFLQVGKEGKQP